MKIKQRKTENIQNKKMIQNELKKLAMLQKEHNSNIADLTENEYKKELERLFETEEAEKEIKEF